MGFVAQYTRAATSNTQMEVVFLPNPPNLSTKMSMNLHFTSKGKDLGVWQTPNIITYLCLAPNKLGAPIPWVVTGKAARRALNLYRIWVDQQTSGLWTSENDYRAKCKSVDHHLKEIDSFSKNKKIEAYMM